VTALALTLILLSAAIHAVWNLLTKRIGGGAETVWIFGVVGTVVYGPFAAVAWWQARSTLGPLDYGFLAGTGGLQLLYFLLLVRGYRSGDLSVVYPLARGTGPLLAVGLAVALLGERPGWLTVAGALLIGAGVVAIAFDGRPTRRVLLGAGVGYGVAIGAVIAVYTIWDGYAVSRLEIPPVLQGWASEVARAVLLLPLAARRRAAIGPLWGQHRTALIAVGVLSPLAYLIVLITLQVSPVSTIAPLREVSILFGAVLSAWLLHERHLARRLPAAMMIVVGIAALTLG